MFLRCPWVPALLIWQQLSFLVLAAPLSERHWVPPTTKPELSPEPWSLPNLLPELPDALTPQLQPEGFDDLESSAPSLELSPILESAEQTELSQVQPEAQTRNHKPTKVQSSLPLQEVKDQLSQPPEEAEPSVTQQAPRAQYELGTEEHTGQLSMHQEANAPSGSRSEAHHSNMAFVTVRPVDMKVTTSAEAGKKPQPTSSHLQTLTEAPESPEEEEPSSTLEEILAQTSELSEEMEMSSTHQEAPAQPLGPLVEAELSATKTKPAQPSESSRTEEPSEIQLKAPDQPSDLETEELETSPTQLKQPAQLSEHGEERVSTPHHHKAKHPHLLHVTGKPLNLQLAKTPEPTTEEGNFPVLPKAAAQPSTPVNDVEPSLSQQEAPSLFSEPSEGAELSQFQQEAPATSAELTQQETQVGNLHTFEEGEPSWTTQEAAAQPPELPNELIPQPPELQEKTVSPVGDEQVQPPTLTRGAVTSAESLSSEVEIESSSAQEAPAQSSVSLEQLEPLGDSQELTTPQPNPAVKDELFPFDREVPTPHPEIAGEHSPAQPQSLAMSPGSSGVAVSPMQQELVAQFSGLPGKVILSLLLTERVTFSAQPSEPPEDTEPFSVPWEDDAAPLSEPPNEMEPSQAQQMTPPQPAEEEEPSPALPPAASPPPHPPEEVELSPTQPIMLPQLPSEPPSESAAHPPPRSETTVPTPAQGQAQQPSVALHPSDLEATIIPERTTNGEFSTALKKATALPPKHHEVTLPPPDWVQTQHSKLSLLTGRPLHRKLISAPGTSAKVRSFPTMPKAPSQPPEPPKVVPTPASHEVKVGTPGLEPAQHPTPPTITDQPLNLELTAAVLTIETQVSVPLQEAASPPLEQPKVMLTHPKQVQAQHPNLAEVTIQPLDVKFVVTEYSVSHSPGKASTLQEKQNARTHTDICELCTCRNETLSCTGLRPKHKLHQVPVLEPNNTFTTFNFQENAIFHLGKKSWTTYRWAEKLNLSENGLTGLHKNSFKGLLSLRYLDLSCNKIQFIEAQTFEALPFLQVLNLRCNLVTQISFGTFRAWHGMQLLHRVILNHNPLSSVEDSYLFKLPALRYLDLGTTHTPLLAVENILMMTLELKTLIIPRHMVCCLCQFKSDIEVVCKTVKLHCDSECVTNPTQCLEEAPVGNPEGVFMKVLQARKKNTKTELVIESGKSSSEQSDVSWSDFMDEELDSNDENDVAGVLNHILPYFSEVNLEDVDSLLPPIQLLFSAIQNEANPQGYMKGNMKNPSHQPVSSSLAYRNELKKLYFLQSWLDAEIQGKLEEVKKKEKTGMLTQSSLSSPKFHIIPDVPEKLASAQAQENRLVEDQHEGKRQRTVDRVLKGPKGLRKRLLEERQKEKVREKQSTQPLAKNTADRRSLRSPSTEKPGQNEGVLGPGNPLRTEQKVPVSSALQDPLLRRPATSALPKAPHWARNGAKDLTNSIWVLKNASARVNSMKATKPILGSKNGHDLYKTASLKAHRTLEADPREQLMEEDTRGKLKIAEGPLFAALRSLIHFPSQGLLSSSGDPRVQDHPFPELHDPAETTTIENQAAGNTPEKNVFATNSLISATNSALTLISTDDHTNERHWEYTSTSSEPPPPETSVPLLSSPGDEFETQLNQQLHILIPNKEFRRFIWYMIRTFKRDCSEPSMHLACAKLISRTGLLMKLLMLSEQQEEKVAQAQWDTEQWKSETYIKESSGVSSNQKAQGEPRGHTQEVPGHGYNKKLILAILVTGTSMLLIIILCLIKICSHRTASGKDDRGSSNSVWRQRRKYSRKKDSQEGVSRFRLLLWFRDLSRLLRVTQQQSMVQKLHDKDSSDEDESVVWGATDAPSEAKESTKSAE